MGHLFLCPWQFVCQFSTISIIIHNGTSGGWRKFQTKIYEVYEVPRTQDKMSSFFKFEVPPGPAPPTPLVFSLVLLHTVAIGKRLFRGSVHDSHLLSLVDTIHHRDRRTLVFSTINR